MPHTEQGFIPASAHNEARRFKSGDFITGEANFTTTRNSFTLLDILGRDPFEIFALSPFHATRDFTRAVVFFLGNVA